MLLAKQMRSTGNKLHRLPVPQAVRPQQSRLYSRSRWVPIAPRLAPTTSTLRTPFQAPARFASEVPFSRPRDLAVPSQASQPYQNVDQPSYQLTFTCKPCSHRSSHRVSKQGYHKGTVLITCPNCKNRHIISDHLKVFVDEKSTLEDILRRKAAPGSDLSKLLKKGQLGIRQGEMVGNEGEQDIEFWEDGSQTLHKQKNDQ